MFARKIELPDTDDVTPLRVAGCERGHAVLMSSRNEEDPVIAGQSITVGRDIARAIARLGDGSASRACSRVPRRSEGLSSSRIGWSPNLLDDTPARGSVRRDSRLAARGADDEFDDVVLAGRNGLIVE
jgi:hypothetical protein